MRVRLDIRVPRQERPAHPVRGHRIPVHHHPPRPSRAQQLLRDPHPHRGPTREQVRATASSTSAPSPGNRADRAARYASSGDAEQNRSRSATDNRPWDAPGVHPLLLQHHQVLRRQLTVDVPVLVDASGPAHPAALHLDAAPGGHHRTPPAIQLFDGQLPTVRRASRLLLSHRTHPLTRPYNPVSAWWHC